jgi:hypothetical protein
LAFKRIKLAGKNQFYKVFYKFYFIFYIISAQIISRNVHIWLKRIELVRELKKKRDQEFLENIAIKEKRLAAAKIIRNLIIGFINRHEQYSEINKVFLKKMYEVYLIKLSKSKLPSNLLDEGSWPAFHSQPLNNVYYLNKNILFLIFNLFKKYLSYRNSYKTYINCILREIIEII